MPASKSWIDETAKDIIWEFEDMLFQNDLRINNKDSRENKFENENSRINIKDYEILKGKVKKQLEDFESYIYYISSDAA